MKKSTSINNSSNSKQKNSLPEKLSWKKPYIVSLSIFNTKDTGGEGSDGLGGGTALTS